MPFSWFRDDLRPWLAAHRRGAVGLVIVLAIVARLAAILVLHEAIESDAAAYLEMARTILAPGPMRDIYGNAAFYSPGYPILLSGVFALTGVGLTGVQIANLVLGALSTALVHRLTERASGDPLAALLAATGYAVLIPAVAGTALVQRENLSVALLLGFCLAVVHLPTARRPRTTAAVAGLAYGAGLLAGASVVLTAPVALLAMAWRREGPLRWTVQAALFGAAALLVVAPWVVHVDRVLGRPTLTTNAPFNLYIGNNPAANGRFVSLRDTPVAHQWHPVRDRLGELGATDWLGAQARTYIVANPARTLALAAKKLALFWLPDLPDATDARQGRAIAAIRWADVAQHLAVTALLLVAVLGWRRRSRAERLIVMTIALFWAIHAVAYVMPRYRQPAMPLALVLAAGVVARGLARPRHIMAESVSA